MVPLPRWWVAVQFGGLSTILGPQSTMIPHATTPLSMPRRAGRAVLGLIDGSYISTGACDEAFKRMHTQDQIGDRLHLIFAWIGCVGLLGPQTIAQIAMAPVFVFFFVRVLNTSRIWIHGFGQPAVLTALALAAWMAGTLLWSADILSGLHEMAQLRWVLLAGLLYPVIEKRTVLIWALLVGYLFVMLAQVIDAFNGFGNPVLAEYFWHDPARISGWFQPVVGGSVLVAGLGLVLPIAAFDHGKMRLFGIIGSLLMMGSIVVTGSRGAWIAMVALMMFVALFAVFARRVRFRSIVLGGCVAAVVFSAVVFLAGNSIRHRIDLARADLSHAIDGQYNTDTGARILMMKMAAKATAAHPIAGVGVGGYKDWASSRTMQGDSIHDHAHNTPLHLSATTGLVGFGLACLLLVVLVRNSFKAATHFAGDSGGYGFSIGPMFAIIGLAMVSMTDAVLINAQTSALLGVLAALSPAYAPGMKSKAAISTD